jgi:hypothetical protein
MPQEESARSDDSVRAKGKSRQRPYRDECTGSLSNSEVNRRRARSVLGWGTAWEALWVLLAFCCHWQNKTEMNFMPQEESAKSGDSVRAKGKRCQRPYRDECTGSLSNSEVNRRRARSVLGWGTAWEALWVLLAF